MERSMNTLASMSGDELPRKAKTLMPRVKAISGRIASDTRIPILRARNKLITATTVGIAKITIHIFADIWREWNIAVRAFWSGVLRDKPLPP
jgi:hypothetical protein